MYHQHIDVVLSIYFLHLYVCIENTRARSLLVLSFFLSFEPSNLSRKKRRIPREKEKNKTRVWEARTQKRLPLL